MSDEREELVCVISDLPMGLGHIGPSPAALVADAILAAGYHRQPVVSPDDCRHEFTDHCGICGMDAAEWYDQRRAARPETVEGGDS